MPDLRISESGSVQFPMVSHAVEIGWTALDPETAKARRGGVSGVLFSKLLLRGIVAHPSVNYVTTVPGPLLSTLAATVTDPPPTLSSEKAASGVPVNATFESNVIATSET